LAQGLRHLKPGGLEGRKQPRLEASHDFAVDLGYKRKDVWSRLVFQILPYEFN
jgi:hypothetical protein